MLWRLLCLFSHYLYTFCSLAAILISKQFQIIFTAKISRNVFNLFIYPLVYSIIYPLDYCLMTSHPA